MDDNDIHKSNGTERGFEARAQKVRLDLKQWEADFADSHHGRKPSREDIKNNPSIAQKYKDYYKLRDIISGKLPAPAPVRSRRDPESTKRKPDAPSPAEHKTPLKKPKHFATPSKDQAAAEAYVDSNGFMVSPVVSRKLFSPAAITCLGPTPQRDGKVLGLFDLLVEKELGISPNKPGLLPSNSRSLGRQATAAAAATATPQKQTVAGQLHGAGNAGAGRLGQTPTSGRRGRGLGTFATPRKNKDDGGGAEEQSGTPSSASRLMMFDTPAFLKRQKLPTVDENAAYDAPAPLRLPRKPFTRGLSEIITSLRKVEEEQADEDLQALHEAMSGEFELPGRSLPPKAQTRAGSASVAKNMNMPPGGASASAQVADILGPDTEKPQLLGGFDDEGLYDSPVEEAGEGRPTRIFKKKGQKRTTRKVNMRPTRYKRPVESSAADDDDDDDEGSDAHDGAVAVEVAEAKAKTEEADDASGPENGHESNQDFEDEDAGGDDNDDDDSPRKQRARRPGKTSTAPGEQQKEKGGAHAVKRTVRKVNELAHANFQRLKLRNRGAKGGPAHNSRFRRRR